MTIRRLAFLAAMAPTLASAQAAGTIELGAMGHYTRMLNVNLGDQSVGLGARIGFFALRQVSLEAEYSFGTIGDNNRGVDMWLPFRGFVVGNLPVGPRMRIYGGLGYKADTWKGDTTDNQFEDAFTMLAGLRICVGSSGRWSVRPELVYDKNPSPNNQFPITETSRHIGARIGISRFMGRRAETCRNAPASPAGAMAPPPAAAPRPGAAGVTPPPAAVVPPPIVAPAPAPTATINASPASIVAGSAAVLTWNSTNAMRCTAPWTNSSSSAGNQSVSPTTTTSYTVACSGAGGTANATTTVTVRAPAPPPVAPTPAAPPPREIFRLEGVFFDLDKSVIKPEGRLKLDSAVTILNRIADMRVEVAGHTDSLASESYNQALSERRAKAVVDYLVSKGISASRLTPRGYGEAQPAADNGTDAGRAQNRRVMLIEMR